MKKIMVIDDNEIDRNIIRFALENIDTDIDVQEVSSGKEACVNLSNFNPDLVILDLRMPGMDGIETLEAIKKINGLKPLKVIMLSGSDDKREMNLALFNGADAYFTKPTNYNGYITIAQKLKKNWLSN